MSDGDASLSADVLALTEVLARHMHDAWIRVRLEQGWTLGPRRDDDRKQHPCLIPYEQLPEAEKECDRQATLATLRAVKTLGFDIVRRD
jgi:hypothetical protein